MNRSTLVLKKPNHIYFNCISEIAISNKLEIMADIKLPYFDFLYKPAVLLGSLEIAAVSECLHCVGVVIVVVNPLRFD